jgi:hypothetical protein
VRHPTTGLLRWFTLLAMVALLAGCEFVQLPDGGYSIKPDQLGGPRLLIIGDSLMRQPSLSVAFGNLDGGIETLVEAVNTSGLVSGPVHWDQRDAELIAQFHPTVVLLGFSGHFTEPYWPPYNPPGAPGSAEYQAWITQQRGSLDFLDRQVDAATAMTKQYQDAGATVYWVEAPPYPPQFGRPSPADRLWARFVSDLPVRRPGTGLLSVRSSVADATGGWMEYKTICGTSYPIRNVAYDGGLHFTADGAGTYGRALARTLAAAEGWPLPAPKCPGQTD